jgi:Electron transfer DM13
MLPTFRAGLAAGAVLTLLVTTSALAQDSAMAKKDTMDHGAMMDHGTMMDHAMMGPHGMFAGAHDHKVSGGFSVAEKDGKQLLMLGEDFSLDGAPDPYIVLSGNEMGSGPGTLNLGRLKTKRGSAAFPIPAGTDLAKYTQVLVWCKKFNVTLGQAQLAASDQMMHN